jgi:hypothetical protein
MQATWGLGLHQLQDLQVQQQMPCQVTVEHCQLLRSCHTALLHESQGTGVLTPNADCM